MLTFLIGIQSIRPSPHTSVFSSITPLVHACRSVVRGAGLRARAEVAPGRVEEVPVAALLLLLEDHQGLLGGVRVEPPPLLLVVLPRPRHVVQDPRGVVPPPHRPLPALPQALPQRPASARPGDRPPRGALLPPSPLPP